MHKSNDFFTYEPTIADYCAEALEPGRYRIVAFSQNRVPVGFALAAALNYNTVEIITMAVVPAHRGQGIGSALLEKIAENARAENRKLVMLKTYGPTQCMQPFQFFVNRGYCMLDEFDFIWQDHYCAIMAKKV